MVAKIGLGSSLFGVLTYNHNKIEDKEAKILDSNRIILGSNGEYKMGKITQSFEPYLLANRKTEKPIMHISLNPDPKDRLTDEQFSDIAKEYLQKMGYGDQPYIVYKHEDIDRHHIHIVTVRVDELGKKLDSNYEHRRSMKACRDIEKSYNLTHADKKEWNQKRENAIHRNLDGELNGSFKGDLGDDLNSRFSNSSETSDPSTGNNNKSKGKLRDRIDRSNRQYRENLSKVNYQNGDIKSQIANVINPLSKRWYFLSLREYNTLLSKYNIAVEEVKRGDIDQDINGLIYYATDDKGKRIGHGFKASLFDRSTRYTNIDNRFSVTAQSIKSRKCYSKMRDRIGAVINISKDRNELQKNLQKCGVEVLFRTNKEGRIYGVTFIDHNEHLVINGSRLGKKFSINALNKLYGEYDMEGKKNHSDGAKDEKPDIGGEELEREKSDDSRHRDDHSNDTNRGKTDRSSEQSLVEELSGIFSIENGGVDYEEEAFIHRMKRKKRKRKGLKR